MVYYFRNGLAGKMYMYDVVTLDGMKVMASARMISIFEEAEVLPEDVSVWMIEDGSHVAKYIIGNPRVLPHESLKVFYLTFVESVHFVCYASDEDVAQALVSVVEDMD